MGSFPETNIDLSYVKLALLVVSLLALMFATGLQLTNYQLN